MIALPTSLCSGLRRIAWIVLTLALGIVDSRAASNEQWLKVAAPEFTVITTLREKEAVAWAAEFSQFVAALQDFIRVPRSRLPRLTLVVFARERDFNRFKPLRPNGTPMEVAGFFSRRPSWAVAGLAASGLRDETRTTIFHEGTHWFLSAFELPNPVWLEEGLAEVFSTFGLEGKKLSWGRVIEPHVQALNMLRPMPLERFLFLAKDNLHGEGELDSIRTGLAYAQSWAFVHYLIFGQREVPKKALTDYVARLRTMHPDEAFQTAFGGSYTDIDKKFEIYLRSGRYYVARFPLAELPASTIQPASVAEVEEALARLRMVGGRHNEARENVARAIAAEPENPRVYELEGEFAQETGDLTAARAAYQKAVDRGSIDFRPYFELAAAEHAAAATSEGGALRDLAPEKARAIANGYERAINLNPRHRPAYQGLAGIVGIVPPGNKEDLSFLELGLKLFPDDGMIRLGLAVSAKREGDAVRARTLLDEVLNAADTAPRVAAYARRLDSSWQQRDVFAEIDALAKEKKFADAVALLEERLKSVTDFGTRMTLQRRRDQLHVSDTLEQARTAIRERRWADAREKFDAVLESNASPLLKAQVRRQLESLGHRGLKKDP